VAAVDTGKKLEKLIKEMLVRGGGGGGNGGQIESDQMKLKDHVGCQSTMSGATNGSMVSGSEANNLNRFLDIQINKNKVSAPPT
jgi:hypothetical protein